MRKLPHTGAPERQDRGRTDPRHEELRPMSRRERHHVGRMLYVPPLSQPQPGKRARPASARPDRAWGKPRGKTMMLAYGATHRGRKRENNEDAFHIEEPLAIAILADGMGGESCGEVGSAITVRAVTEYMSAPEPGLSREEVVKEAIRAANRQVIDAAKLRTECDGMGSTIVMAVWDGSEVIIANVGDSRAYLYRGGELRQLSYDQNFANDLRTKLGVSEEPLRTMPNRHVLTMAVGPFEHVLVRTHAERLEPGDRVL